MENRRRIFARITAKAWAEPAFKERLLAEPAAVMTEFGVEIPPGVTVHMHENTMTDRHAVLIIRPTGFVITDWATLERIVPLQTDITIDAPIPYQKMLAKANKVASAAKKVASAAKKVVSAAKKKIPKPPTKKSGGRGRSA